MKINWRERLKNKTFLISASGMIIALIYQIIAIISPKVPHISEDIAVEIAGIVINLLGILGVVVDPTTCGVCDSERALTYGTDEDVRQDETADTGNGV